MIVYRETSDIRKGDQLVMTEYGGWAWRLLSVTDIVASEDDITYVGDRIPATDGESQAVVRVRPCDRVPVLLAWEKALT